MRKVAGSVDDLFGTVIKQAIEIAENEDRMADSLAWLRDQAIFFAQHPEAVRRLREDLERQESSLEARTAVARDATTCPAGGSVVSILDRIGPRP